MLDYYNDSNNVKISDLTKLSTDNFNVCFKLYVMSSRPSTSISVSTIQMRQHVLQPVNESNDHIAVTERDGLSTSLVVDMTTDSV